MTMPVEHAGRTSPPAELIDEHYYQVVPPRSLGERLMIAARRRIYDDFIRLCRPSPEAAILDVGVSEVINDGANMLEQRYPYQDRITGAGLGPGRGFRTAFPRAGYRQIEANQPLPFTSKSFDIAMSNAVLEHVGSVPAQISFVRDLARVARQVFITVPNRYFPVEHHTAIPVLHYWAPAFGLACRLLAKSEWAAEANLILMSRARLLALAPSGASMTVGATGIALGPFSSNLFAFIDIAGGQGR